jgi:acyl-coenzyme A thioesterase PaaI-like protein
MTEAASQGDVRRAWLDEDEASLSAARVAKHRLVEQVRRLVDAAFQLDTGDVGYGADGTASDTGSDSDSDSDSGSDTDTDTDTDTDRAARFMALAADAEALADRIGALPRIPRAEIEGVNASQARRHDTLLVERSTVNGRGNPLAPPMRMWADGEVIRGEAYFTAPYEGPAGRVHGAWVAACFDEILGCAQGASGAFGYTGTLTITLRRATPLYTKITYEAGFSHREGRKIHGWGRCYADGRLTAEATGVFVIPANGRMGHGTAQ